ncbi:hypothetical protein [Dechloromonas sp. ZS-1]|uniref:hypothetical protein n=1 Tax=Dechloromonas sp. ZS-1 TaxID=3138067 RepID=UPI0031FC6B8E
MLAIQLNAQRMAQPTTDRGFVVAQFAFPFLAGTGRVMGPSLREILDFRQLTDQMFGRQSLASHVLQDEHDYDLADQLTSISDITQDFALRTEFACGAKPEELSTVRQRSVIN